MEKNVSWILCILFLLAAIGFSISWYINRKKFVRLRQDTNSRTGQRLNAESDTRTAGGLALIFFASSIAFALLSLAGIAH